MKILSKLKYLINKPQIDFSALYRDTDTDFEIVGDTSEILDKIPLARNRFNGIQYNQNEVSPVSCTVHGAATAVTALTNIKFLKDQRTAIWDAMKKDVTGSEVWGGYVDSAVKKWADYWNSLFPNDRIEFARVYMGTTQMYTLLEKGYMIDMSYRAIEGYQQDWFYDAIVNRQWDEDADLEEYGNDTGMGHCLALCQSDIYSVKGHNIINVDNYVDSENRKNNNIYGIDRSVIPRLVDNNRRIWNHWGYVYYFKKDFDDANIEVDRKLLQRLSKAQIDSGRFVNLQGTNRYGIVQFGKFTELKGRDLSEGFALRNGSINESLVLPLSENKWISIGGNK